MQHAPCMTEPRMWDLDQATPDDLVEAQEACGHCAFLTSCRSELDATDMTPRSQWRAGLGFDEKAHVLSLDAARKFVANRRGSQSIRSLERA